MAQAGRSFHEHMPDAGRILMRFIKGRVILYVLRIEDDNIGEIADLQEAALFNIEICRRERCQPADRLLERHDLLVANVLAEQACEISVGAGMRV